MYARTYDAFPFFEHLEKQGAQIWALWPHLPAANDAAFVALTEGGRLLQDWPSTFFRTPAWGPAWEVSGSSVPAFTPPLSSSDLGNGASVTLSSGVAAPAGTLVHLAADLVTIAGSATGHLRTATGQDSPLAEAAGTYCTRVDGCSCPDSGRTPQYRGVIPAGELAIAMTGGTSPATITMSGAPLACDLPSGHWSLHTATVSMSGFSAVYSPIQGHYSLDIAEDPDGDRTVGMTLAAEAILHADAEMEGQRLSSDWQASASATAHVRFDGDSMSAIDGSFASFVTIPGAPVGLGATGTGGPSSVRYVYTAETFTQIVEVTTDEGAATMTLIWGR